MQSLALKQEIFIGKEMELYLVLTKKSVLFKTLALEI